MFQRIAMLISLTFFTACAAVGPQQSGLASRQDPLLGELLLLGAIAEAGRGSDSDYGSSSSGGNDGNLLLALALIAGGVATTFLLIDGGEVDGEVDATQGPIGPDYNVGAPDFVRVALTSER